MQAETQNCQNCKKDFVIEPEDFQFYEKIKVPPPTWCPECRLVRRLMFRNERALYKRNCDLCKEGIISVYPEDSTFPVYCPGCWYGDKWDGLDYGKDLDISQNFFEQLYEIWKVAPRMSAININAVNSPFGNGIVDSKGVYLSYSIIKSENVFFSKSIDSSSQVLDSVESVGLDQCYENINSERNYRSHFMNMSDNCVDSWFLYDCVNCKNCILSSNLQNKQYVIRNKQYSSEEYRKELERLELGSSASVEALKKEFEEMKLLALHKYADIKKSVNASGSHLQNVKNANNCFEAYDAENIKFCYRVIGMKDMYDVSYGGWAEMRYEHMTAGQNSYDLKFSFTNPSNLRNSEYVAYCMSSAHLFGCVGVKNKEYVILNKQYTKEEYETLVLQIKKIMDENPYVDLEGRVWKYGEFFPLKFTAILGYNQSVAQELFPLTREEALSKGYSWKDFVPKAHTASVKADALPDRISDVGDDILSQIISCLHGGGCDHQCTSAYKIIPDELVFYRQQNIPLPRLCPNCRHYERLRQMEPLKLWKDKCDCAGDRSVNGNWENTVTHLHGKEACSNFFKTPHPPGHPETLYCEQCYQQEVA